MNSDKTLITANLKVAALLDAYPELEQVLIDLAPPFQKLRHPVLRRTVARVTTLAQAARVAGVPLGELVQTLRTAAGQAEAPSAEAPAGAAPASAAAPATGATTSELAGCDAAGGDETLAAGGDETPAPDWVRNGEIAAVLDADALLASGENPLREVSAHLAQLQPHQVLVIEGSFRPEPLIDLLTSQGRPIHVAQRGPDQYRTFIGSTRPAGR